MNKFKVSNSMWSGLVGKEKEGKNKHFLLTQMLQLTSAAKVGGHGFDMVDLMLAPPHVDVSNDDLVRSVADQIGRCGFEIGSLVAPVWPDAGGGSAMGSDAEQEKFLAAVKRSCEIAQIFDAMGIRKRGVIRIDSAEHGVATWMTDPVTYTRRIADTFQKAGKIAEDHGQRLAAEGEICWAGMHSWKDFLDLLEAVDMMGTVGAQIDLAHTYLFLLGYNAPQHALLQPGYTEAEFWPAYEKLVSLLKPWMLDFHAAQNDGTVFGSGTHDKTGRHCPPNDPNGKLDIVRCAKLWLEGCDPAVMSHICWDGCMFSNEVLENAATWRSILGKLFAIREACPLAA